MVKKPIVGSQQAVHRAGEPSPLAAEALLGGLLSTLGMVAFEPAPRGGYRLLGDSASWLDAFLGRRLESHSVIDLAQDFLFLHDYLDRLEGYWASPKESLLQSGPWSEPGADGSEYHFEAVATLAAGRKVLLLEHLSERYRRQQALFQGARESVLNHQRLAQEVEEKEVLLHCIVHDLAGPLTGIQGSLSWLQREELSQTGQRRLSTGQKAAGRLESFIQDILEVFSVESGPEDDHVVGPDLLPCARNVVEVLGPTALLRDLAIELELSDRIPSEIRVVGEATRLERVFYNLLDNALRYSPKGGTIRLKVIPGDHEVEVSVEDQGPGVPAEIEETLFQKFMRGGSRAGRAGLGLYFCRIVVQRWGGSIGYARVEPGVSRFWFRLPTTTSKGIRKNT